MIGYEYQINYLLYSVVHVTLSFDILYVLLFFLRSDINNKTTVKIIYMISKLAIDGVERAIINYTWD